MEKQLSFRMCYHLSMLAVSTSFAFDLGTRRSRIWQDGVGNIADELSVVICTPSKKDVLAFGDQASDMAHVDAHGFEAVWPIERSVVADTVFAKILVAQMFKKASVQIFPYTGIHAVMTQPADATSLQRSIARKLLRSLGISDSLLVPSPLAAAIGSGVAFRSTVPSLCLHLGEGNSSLMLVAAGFPVWVKRLGFTGDYLSTYLWTSLMNLGIAVPRRSLWQLVPLIEKALDPETNSTLELTVPSSLQARRSKRGVQKISVERLREMLYTPLQELAFVVQSQLEKMESWTAGSLIEQGILLTGGVAQLPGIAGYLRRFLSLPVYTAQQSEQVSIEGAAKFIPFFDEVEEERLWSFDSEL